MPKLIIFLMVVATFAYTTTQSQVLLEGRVTDAATGEALPWCSITVKGTGKGTVTNTEGVFMLAVRSDRDTLLFSYVGYRSLSLAAKRIMHDRLVTLERTGIQLKELVIHADDEYLFRIVEKCRKRILRDKRIHAAKVYYGIETLTREQPIELVECYYNGYLKGISFDSMLFRNGRVGCAELDQRYFLTLNTSKAVSRLSLTVKDPYYPYLPLQLTGKELRNAYELVPETGDRELIRIGFRPRSEPLKHFCGSVWISRTTSDIVKIELKAEKTVRHPFSPIYRSDRLGDVDFSITETFRQTATGNTLEHVNFSYAVTYHSSRGIQGVVTPASIPRRITTHGLLYLYDYETPFILPYFEYDAGFDDYRKMSIIPFNPEFWTNNHALVLTGQQKQSLGFFADHGLMVNFEEKKHGRDFLDLVHYDSALSENYYTFWDSTHRFSLNRSLPQNREYPPKKINGAIRQDLYRLDVQLLLDVTGAPGDYLCRSFTVFDERRSRFHLPDEKYTRPFINIYFDLYEAERRKMQRALDAGGWSALQVDSIYQATVRQAKGITTRYLHEVKAGKEIRALERWNKVVEKELGVDHFTPR